MPNHQGLGCLRSSRLISGDSQRGAFLPLRNEGCAFLEPLDGVFVGDPSQCASQYSEGLSEVRKGNNNACNGVKTEYFDTVLASVMTQAEVAFARWPIAA